MGKKISLPITGSPLVQDLPTAAASPSTRAERAGGWVLDEIDAEVKANKLIIYMKGTPEQPMCGFSARAVQILSMLGKPFAAVDVLASPAKREGIKHYGEWPTIPQVYLNGELLGGSDILLEMYQSGELQQLADAAFE